MKKKTTKSYFFKPNIVHSYANFNLFSKRYRLEQRRNLYRRAKLKRTINIHTKKYILKTLKLSYNVMQLTRLNQWLPNIQSLRNFFLSSYYLKKRFFRKSRIKLKTKTQLIFLWKTIKNTVIKTAYMNYIQFKSKKLLSSQLVFFITNKNMLYRGAYKYKIRSVNAQFFSAHIQMYTWILHSTLKELKPTFFFYTSNVEKQSRSIDLNFDVNWTSWVAATSFKANIYNHKYIHSSKYFKKNFYLNTNNTTFTLSDINALKQNLEKIYLNYQIELEKRGLIPITTNQNLPIMGDYLGDLQNIRYVLNSFYPIIIEDTPLLFNLNTNPLNYMHIYQVITQ